MSTPQAPAPAELKLSDAVKALVNNALPAGHPMSFAYVDDKGLPNLSFRGSVQAYSDTQLAMWVRNPEGGLAKAIAAHPAVALLYSDLTPASRAFLTFRGLARIDSNESVRSKVFENSVEAERNLDKERKGLALVIDLTSVHGLAGGERLNMAKAG